MGLCTNELKEGVANLMATIESSTEISDDIKKPLREIQDKIKKILESNQNDIQDDRYTALATEAQIYIEQQSKHGKNIREIAEQSGVNFNIVWKKINIYRSLQKYPVLKYLFQKDIISTFIIQKVLTISRKCNISPVGILLFILSQRGFIQSDIKNILSHERAFTLNHAGEETLTTTNATEGLIVSPEDDGLAQIDKILDELTGSEIDLDLLRVLELCRGTIELILTAPPPAPAPQKRRVFRARKKTLPPPDPSNMTAAEQKLYPDREPPPPPPPTLKNGIETTRTITINYCDYSIAMLKLEGAMRNLQELEDIVEGDLNNIGEEELAELEKLREYINIRRNEFVISPQENAINKILEKLDALIEKVDQNLK
jgi:hypothetical protein